MNKYFGRWDNYEDMVNSFFPRDYRWEGRDRIDLPRELPANFPTEDEIIFASYGGGDYDGNATVIYERNGTLLEVHGSHCSCYGLEDQWDPEDTSWAALRMRVRESTPGRWDSPLYDHDEDAKEKFNELALNGGRLI